MFLKQEGESSEVAPESEKREVIAGCSLCDQTFMDTVGGDVTAENPADLLAATTIYGEFAVHSANEHEGKATLVRVSIASIVSPRIHVSTRRYPFTNALGNLKD